MERTYTVREIDALEKRWLFGTSVLKGTSHGRCYNEKEKTACVEELVRTHMLAGHVSDDIYKADA